MKLCVVGREPGKEGRRREEEILREGSRKRRQRCVWHEAKVGLGEGKGRNLLEGEREWVGYDWRGDDKPEPNMMMRFKLA